MVFPTNRTEKAGEQGEEAVLPLVSSAICCKERREWREVKGDEQSVL